MHESRKRLLGVIGGSQAYTLVKEEKFSGERIGPLRTPFGSSQPVYRIKNGETQFLLLSRHGENRYCLTPTFVNYRANIFALKEIGATHIIAWSGPGSFSKDLPPGSFVIVDDIIDNTTARSKTFFENTGVGFIRMSEPFCPSMRALISDTMKELNIECVSGATYVCTEGPRLETPAEIRMYKMLGANLVGMTLAPEVFLAKELELCYAAICYVTNYAEGIKDAPLDPEVLFGGMADEEELEKVRSAVDTFPAIIKALAANLPSILSDCSCAQSMSRYKKSGRLNDDWRTWFE